MQKRLIKACLILLSHDQNIEIVVEFLLGLILLNVASVRTNIEAGFRIGFIAQRYFTGERDHGLHIHIAVFLRIALDFLEIQHRSRTGGCDNHHFPLPLIFWRVVLRKVSTMISDFWRIFSG